jgi:hypothetical protein
MRSLIRISTKRFSLTDAIRSRVSTCLYQSYSEEEGLLGNLDRWTQQRITDKNLAKLALVLDSDDPTETCYQDLIREIDAEAENGIYLVRSDSTLRHLRRLIDEPGVSGEMCHEIIKIAPIVFPDQTANSTDDLDRVWATIHASHNRAHVNATVSEIIMSFLLDDGDAARDMGNAMRALHYSFHEDIVRRRCKLPLLINDQDSRELRIMVTELAKRNGK